MRDYDPAWPEIFGHISQSLGNLLGEMVADIVHIGSTAIPGLCAKPKIDVDVVLHNEAYIEPASSILIAAGYTAHGNKYNDGMWAFTTGRGSYGERIYLCTRGNATHQKRLFFRNHLRSNPDDAARYAALKKHLASETSSDWNYYTGGKTSFIDAIVRRAIADSIRHVPLPSPETDRTVLASIAPDGFATGFIRLHYGSSFPTRIDDIYVTPQWRRSGIGTALLKIASQQGGLLVITSEPSADAAAFFSACGFQHNVRSETGGAGVLMMRPSPALP